MNLVDKLNLVFYIEITDSALQLTSTTLPVSIQLIKDIQILNTQGAQPLVGSQIRL